MCGEGGGVVEVVVTRLGGGTQGQTAAFKVKGSTEVPTRRPMVCSSSPLLVLF